MRIKVLIGCFTGIFWISSAAHAAATEASPPVLVATKRLSLDSALKLAQAAIGKCRREGVQVAVTVVDRSGHVQVVLRDVLAMDLALVVSRDKAYTAVSFNSSTSALEGRFNGAYAVPKEPGILIAGGGLPIQAGGQLVGGVGVSGAPSGTTDEACAKAGVQAIQSDLDMAD
ncbi:MAG: heme-binding protein [Gammaproteobacteria bacterium]|nr:heme-binding protein [Gammaproteobacteria bacterium]